MSWAKILFIQKTKTRETTTQKNQHYWFRSSLFSDFVSILYVQRQSCSHLPWVREAAPQTQLYPELHSSQHGGAAKKWDTHMWLVLCKLRPWAKINPIPSSAIPEKLIIDQVQMSLHTPEPLQQGSYLQE